MDRDEHVRWLHAELAKHDQPCNCGDCAGHRAELAFFGEDPRTDSTPTIVERAA